MNIINETVLAPQSGLLSMNGCRRRAAEEVCQHPEVYELFEKQFYYQKPVSGAKKWELAAPNELFKEYYQLEQLQQLKHRLNAVKSKLNDYGIEAWSAHTRRKDPAGEIPWRLKNETKAEFVTVAWCKFFECLHRYPIVKSAKLNSLHLCEAPGAFIAALNHYLQSTHADKANVEWNWLSTTLNPYYEGNPLNKMIMDDRFMLYTLDHWLFHTDFTGNIINVDNINHMEAQCAERLKDGIQLITADGSIDCVSVPDCQEEFVDSLHFSELIAALSVLDDGGSFVVKLFTLFEANSVCKMFLLNCVFEEVHVFKPATSKRGNSEVYVICLGYKKHTKYLKETIDMMKSQLTTTGGAMLPLFAKNHLPQDFLLQHEICQRRFINLQTKAIESNIYSFEVKTRYENKNAHMLRTEVCNEFYQRYKVQQIPERKTILFGTNGKIPTGEKMFLYKGSHSERELKKNITTAEQIFQLRGHLNDLEKTLVRSYDAVYQEKSDVNSLTCPILKVYRGTPFETLHSSLYVSLPILLMRTNLQKLFNIDAIWCDKQHVTFDHEMTFKLDTDYSTDFSKLQRTFLKTLLNELLNKLPKCVEFKNIPFLTHLSVSLLRYLSLSMYSSITINTETEFSVRLEHKYKITDDRQRRQLKELHQLLHTDENLLCVMDIQHLHRTDFSKALHEYNNLLLIRNFKLLLNN